MTLYLPRTRRTTRDGFFEEPFAALPPPEPPTLGSTSQPAAVPGSSSAGRAGAEGCTSTEAQIEAPATSEAELRERLSGRRVGCSGFSGELLFDAEGNLQISSERYQDVREPLKVELQSDGSYAIATSSQTLNVVFAGQPLKLQLTDVADGRPMVFSAMP